MNGLQEVVMLSNGESLNIDGKTRPTVDIRAGVSLHALGLPLPKIEPSPFPSFIPPNLTLTEPATRADININSNLSILETNGLVFLSNQYQPNNLMGNVSIQGNFDVRPQISGGDSADIYIDSRGSLAFEKSLVRTNTSIFGIGQSGSVTLLAKNDISLKQSTIDTKSISSGGNAGEITLNADRILLSNSLIQSDTRSSFRGGNIDITARQVVLDGSSIESFSDSTHPTARGGDITVSASESLEVKGTFSLDQLFPGTTLNETLERAIRNNANQRPSTLLTGTNREAGKAGDITIHTPKLSVRDGSIISTLWFYYFYLYHQYNWGARR